MGGYLLSIYDPPEEPEDLWFLPDPQTESPDSDLSSAVFLQSRLAAPEGWRAAQAQHATALARAALAVGQLDMMVAQIGVGALERLALREAAALLWAAGKSVSLEDIARDHFAARADGDPLDLQTARWALRRLMGQGGIDDLAAFLGLHLTETETSLTRGPSRLSGLFFEEAAQEFLRHVSSLADAHAFTRGAYARFLWALSDLSVEGDMVEGAVWAARHMAQDCMTLTFLPLGQEGRRITGLGVSTFPTLLAAIEAGAIAARAELHRLSQWRDQAHAATAGIKGKNAGRIIEMLFAKPHATTQMVEATTGVSRDTAERLLARLHHMGLVREVTGAKRFRIWAAQL